ncbi:hypothetical protein [Corynebacterium dentalis]|uniref:hypothetical protein n=1 Tax=Corynebacterium dentalis TaxID=2014528 RepID=UPI00370D3CF3
MNLPTPDQPDNYTGIHNRSQVRWVSIETTGTTATGHLLPGALHTDSPQGTTYCTRLNPQWNCDLHGMRYTTRYGGQGRISHGATYTDFTSNLTRVQFRGAPLTWCPHCLTMLAVEAEMIGQRAYPVKKLVTQLEALKPTTGQPHGK